MVKNTDSAKMQKAASQNKKVFEDPDENFLIDDIDECENDENLLVQSTYATEELGINQSGLEINQFFNQLPIRILNSQQLPFFYAEDVAKVLCIRNVRTSITNFTNKEIVSQDLRRKYNITTYCKYKGGVRRNDKAILLTEFGVYRLIMNSRTQVADQFRDFIYDVLYQLRTVGEYKIKGNLEQLQITNEQLQAKVGVLEKEIDTLKHKQNQFKNLCDKLYLIEFPHDPYLIKQKTPKVLMKKSKLAKLRAIESSPALQELAAAKPNENAINDPVPFALQLVQKLNINADFIEVDNDVSGEELKLAHEANVQIAHEIIRNYCPTTSYLITANPTSEQLTAGTCVHSVWVKSSAHAIKKLGMSSNKQLYNEKKENLINLLDAVAD